jgi:hypothetical protein
MTTEDYCHEHGCLFIQCRQVHAERKSLPDVTKLLAEERESAVFVCEIRKTSGVEFGAQAALTGRWDERDTLRVLRLALIDYVEHLEARLIKLGLEKLGFEVDDDAVSVRRGGRRTRIEEEDWIAYSCPVHGAGRSRDGKCAMCASGWVPPA